MVLIVGSSGRMLAQAAKNAGVMPLVIDLFADLDMQNYVADFYQVQSLAESDLVSAVDYFIQRYAVTRFIYGSGFECYPDSLYYLSTRLIILGNDADVFARQLDKPGFFATLKQLNISYPSVVFNPPDDEADWLLKPMQGQGGVGIKRYTTDDDIKNFVYWQKFQDGRSHSVLFLADGREMQVVGFNNQCSVRLSEVQAFVFLGVNNSCELSEPHKAVITDWLRQLVPAFGLKGLNSLDFIHYQGCSYVLEINPRPSASMQLYDQDLLSRHIQSSVGCAGFSAHRLRSDFINPVGYQIVYAEHDQIIPEQFEWPDGCMDLPKPGNICRTGEPICSIIASQIDSGSVAEQLLTKQQLVISKLKGFDQYGIYRQR